MSNNIGDHSSVSNSPPQSKEILLKSVDLAKDSDVIIKSQLYFDAYEKEYGDGFYPQTIPFTGIYNCTSTFISFRLIKYNEKDELAWAQFDNSVIYGFDGDSGIKLLEYLNKEAKVDATKIINGGGRIIYPKIAELSTYRVIEQLSKY